MQNPKEYTEFQKVLLNQLQEIITGIKAVVEKPLGCSIIPEDAELLTVRHVARLTGWGESVVRQRDREGLLPAPLRFGGTIQWSRKELLAWIDAGCPARQKWEQDKA